MFSSAHRWQLVMTLVLLTTPAWCLTNLLPNPGFEADENGDGIADGWSSNIHVNEGAEGSFALDREIRHSGEASQRIEHTSDNAAWVRVSADHLATRPDSVYRVDVWVRGEGHYNVLLYEFFTDNSPYKTNNIANSDATNDWRHISAVVSSSENSSFFKLSLIANGKGTVWFDDASLVLVAERPTLRVPRVKTAPKIDGRVDDKVWRSAPVADGFMILDGGGEPAPVATTARMCFDDEALYISFDCQEPDVADMVTGATEDGSRVWMDDCVEVFLDIDHDRAGYLHLGVSATGFKWQDRKLSGSWYTDWYSTGGGGEVPVPKWSAAAAIGDGSWSAEMRLPFDQIGGPPRPATVWGAQFARTRRATGEEENFCWSYTEGKYYAVPERFGNVVFATGPEQAPAQVSRDLSEPPKPTIVPRPQELKWEFGVFRLGPKTPVVVAPDLDTVGAEMLAADLERRFGLELKIRRGEVALEGISVRVDATQRALKPEGYRLTVGPEGVEVVGKDARGAFYGLQTLRQMVVEDRQGPMLYGCTVQDWPDIAWRGWHLSGPLEADLPTYRKFIDLLALLKFNQICLEVNGNLQYETHPIIARAGSPTKDELKELVAYARARHMVVFPQLATFAHFSYV
ncbi:MAG: hypothetical protein J7M38_00385, partial [Armatimonadetes bacterium]|nr:hypothetical protein [Armatimonadota bacterium]